MSETLFPKGAALIFGATGGIGQFVTKEFVKAGSDVAIMWRSREETANQLAQDIAKEGQKASLHQCDVTDTQGLAKAVAEAIETHGRIHTLVWGAGPLVEQVLISESTSEQWKKAIDTEVHGFFNACKKELMAKSII